MRRDLLVPADARLREGDDPVGARLGDEPCPVEQRVDSFAGVVGRGRQLDPHEPALVEAATEEAGLLEHADEDARIPLGDEGGELVRVDEPARIPKDAIDRTQLSRARHVGDRKAAKGGRIARAREQEGLARLAVAPSAPDHLHVPLERVRVVDEADEPHIGLVDAHAERGRGDDDLRGAGQEVVLDARALLALEAGVVVLGPEPVAGEHARELLGRAARPRVHDRGAAAQRAEAFDEDRDPVLGVGDLLDVVAQVRPHHARVDDVERASERLPDVPRRLRRGRGRHPEERGLAQRFQTAPDEEVVGTEVVAPHAHAVHLVHDHEPDADLGQELDEARLP